MIHRGKSFALTFLSSLNPLAYYGLVERPLRNAVFFYIGTVLLAFVILVGLLIPNFWNLDKEVDKQLSKFDVLKLRPMIATKEPIELKNLGVTINTQTNESTQLTGNILVTDKQIIRKPIECMIVEPYCWIIPQEKRVKYTNFSQMEDVLANKKIFTELLKPLIILALPTIFIIFLIVVSIKYFLLALLLAVISFAVMRIMMRKISLKHTLNATLYLSPVIILPTVINMKFNLNLHYIPVIVYFVAYVVIIVLIGETKMEPDEDE